MLGILTNVQEKPALGHVAPPSAPAGGAAFPKATHRKLSKVINLISSADWHASLPCSSGMWHIHVFTVCTVHTQGG